VRGGVKKAQSSRRDLGSRCESDTCECEIKGGYRGINGIHARARVANKLDVI